MRIYYKLLGNHYHMRVFFNGKAGDLCVGKHEWREFRSLFSNKVEWIEETSE